MKTAIAKGIAFAFTALLATVGMAVPSQATTSVQSSKQILELTNNLTEAGNEAFSDLAGCLIAEKTKRLDVYYLIDNSFSLTRQDPQQVRFQVLQQSISQLGNFAESSIEVRVAAASFDAGSSPLFSGWKTIESLEDSSAKAAEIRQLAEERFGTEGEIGTNWEAGLSAAEELLLSEDSAPCRALIWFTDGAIDPEPGNEEIRDQARLESLNRLCHADVASGQTQAAADYGLLHTLKKERVIIFGVLLQNAEQNAIEQQEDPQRAQTNGYFVSFFRPLIEGIGTTASWTPGEGLGLTPPINSQLQCAQLAPNGLALPGEANGAMLEAKDPVELAFQFLQLSSQLKGSVGSEIPASNEFTIPPGAVAFRVTTTASNSTGEWTLTGPSGSEFQISSSNFARQGVSVQPDPASLITEQAVSIDVEFSAEDAALAGTWTFTGPSPYRTVFIYSGLTMNLDRESTSQIIAERENTLTGEIVREPRYSAAGELNLDLFGSYNLIVERANAGGAWEPAVGASDIELLPGGQFTIKNYNPGPVAGEISRIRLTLDMPEPFSDVRTEFSLEAVDKSSIPTATQTVLVLSNLVGPSGVAEGVLTIQGPEFGEDGQFCIGALSRLSDDQLGIEEIERSDNFSFKFGEQVHGESESCFVIPIGQSVDIPISVTNATQANGSVVAVFESVSSTASDGFPFSEPINLQFETQTEQNDLVVILTIAGLLILGFLLPMTMLYGLNKLTTRFSWPSGVMRAVYDVELTQGSPAIRPVGGGGAPSGGIVLPAPNSGIPGIPGVATSVSPVSVKVDASDFKMVEAHNRAASVNQAEFGELKARVPFLFFISPWFEWQAPPGHRVISHIDTGNKNTKPMQQGFTAEISGSADQIWALVVPESELRTGAKPQVVSPAPAPPGLPSLPGMPPLPPTPQQVADSGGNSGSSNSPVKGKLVVFAKSGSVDSWQKRINLIVNTKSLWGARTQWSLADDAEPKASSRRAKGKSDDDTTPPGVVIDLPPSPPPLPPGRGV